MTNFQNKLSRCSANSQSLFIISIRFRGREQVSGIMHELSTPSSNTLQKSTVPGMALYDSKRDDLDMDAGAVAILTSADESTQLSRITNGSLDSTTQIDLFYRSRG